MQRRRLEALVRKQYCFLANVEYGTVYRRSSKLIVDFLSHLYKNSNFIDNLEDTIFQIKYIQTRFRNLCQIMAQRKHAIRTTILFQHTFLATNALHKTEDEECSMLAKQITMLSDVKKDFITDCFIALAKYDFRIQFLKWFKATKLDKYDVEKN